MSKCIHDYLSFTFTPEPLMRMKSPGQDWRDYQNRSPCGLDRFSADNADVTAAFVAEMSDMLAESLISLSVSRLM